MSRRSLFLHTFFLLLWITLLVFFQLADTTDWISLASRIKPEIASDPGLFQRYLPPPVFERMTPALLVLLSFHLILLVWQIRNKETLQHTVTHLKRVLWYPGWLYVSWQKLTRGEKSGVLLFLAVAALVRIYLSSQTDVIYDEAWSWLAFTSKNPLLATCFYPTSNNHILFSHLTQVTQLAPFSILTNQRLASLIPLLFALLNLLLLTRDRIPFRFSLPAVLVISMTFPLEYYGFVARGYALILFFFTIGFFSALRLADDPRSHSAWTALSVSSALGMYTIPVYLYPMVSLFFFLLIRSLVSRQRPDILVWTRYTLITGSFIILLYLPVFVVSGVAAVTSNKFVQSSDLISVISGLPTHTLNTLRFFSGHENIYLGLGLLLVFALPVWRSLRQNRTVFGLAFFCIGTVPVFILLHRLIPVERTWIYLAVPLFILLAGSFQSIKKPVVVWATALLTIVLLNTRWQDHMLWYDNLCEEDYLAGKHYSELFAGKQAVIITPTRMNSYLKFNAELRHESWDVFESAGTKTTGPVWYIDYRQETLDHSIQTDWIAKDTFGPYRSYLYNKP